MFRGSSWRQECDCGRFAFACFATPKAAMIMVVRFTGGLCFAGELVSDVRIAGHHGIMSPNLRRERPLGMVPTNRGDPARRWFRFPRRPGFRSFRTQTASCRLSPRATPICLRSRLQTKCTFCRTLHIAWSEIGCTSPSRRTSGVKSIKRALFLLKKLCFSRNDPSSR